ncbi:hypothetical protein DYU05_13400 [Mucilaginibacter terrenus]|uniref:Uncharacterized protein n=1 Tax=Mucilaginibacter terrenus TaxID=2482727 RepID=A0A3E2NQ57_9SPHI|nr:hypothetical protein [Mucilaginibacter terrenus]RFZ83138.1 hypothetical protein DYU05_13400 [Mucilaginibacter terrenus]
MIKRLLYIVLCIIWVPCLLSAKSITFTKNNVSGYAIRPGTSLLQDTTNKAKQHDDDKKKIKEVAKAKKQPKPEKIEELDPLTGKPKVKPKRQRRPEGLERPPEIPRRNNN